MAGGFYKKGFHIKKKCEINRKGNEKMTNQEMYKNIFIECLEVKEDELPQLEYMAIKSWDSVGHMNLIAALEKAFDIMMDTDDILDFHSYEKGMEILNGKYNVEF